VGRASNRKKAQRQAAPAHRAPEMTREETYQLLTTLEALVADANERNEREAAAHRAWWCGGREAVPAEAPRWAEGSLGDRFFTGSYLEEARNAPSLLTAQIPDAAVIAADSAHWNVAANVLIRAVAFDGLTPADPAASALLGVLAPIAEAELAHAEQMSRDEDGLDWEDDGFPEQDGPVFLLGGCALVDAVWAVVGEDALTGILGVLARALDGAVPGLDGQAAAEALVAAFAEEYRCELPGDAELLDRIGYPGSNALEILVAAGAVPPADVLRAGLMILAVLAGLCRSGAASLLQPAP
jgi:hypothetical protein